MVKKAVVIHSGGMDSSLCLALAMRQYGVRAVHSLSFFYHQRHSEPELLAAKKICADWGVDHTVIELDVLQKMTESALLDVSIPIQHPKGAPPNTMVVGRNGLMARLGAIFAHRQGAQEIWMGVMGLEGANSGYRDCSRDYMDLMQQILRLDLAEPGFEIKTPLVEMTKAETMAIADELGLLDYLLEETLSCYQGTVCGVCPACLLRDEGITEYTRL